MKMGDLRQTFFLSGPDSPQSSGQRPSNSRHGRAPARTALDRERPHSDGIERGYDRCAAVDAPAVAVGDPQLAARPRRADAGAGRLQPNTKVQ